MKHIFCPKCDYQLVFNKEKYPDGKVFAIVCPQCGNQFKIRIGKRVVKTALGEEKEVNEPDFTYGYIAVIENSFGFKQDLPLILGDNIIGRRNKDTTGVNVPIITSDRSMDRKHCIINVKQNKQGKIIYTLRDMESITGTFLKNKLLEKKEHVLIKDGDIITIGATTFILYTQKAKE